MGIDFTLILASYGALISTLVAIWQIHSIWRDKADVRVTPNIGILGSLNETRKVFMVDIINKGRRPVTISSIQVRLKDGKDWLFIAPYANQGLPKELTEGRSHKVFHNLDKTIEFFKNNVPAYVWAGGSNRPNL